MNSSSVDEAIQEFRLSKENQKRFTAAIVNPLDPYSYEHERTPYITSQNQNLDQNHNHVISHDMNVLHKFNHNNSDLLKSTESDSFLSSFNRSPSVAFDATMGNPKSIDIQRCHLWLETLNAMIAEESFNNAAELQNMGSQINDNDRNNVEIIPEINYKPPPAPLSEVYGPFLNFQTVDLEHNVWIGSALLVTYKSMRHPIVRWVSDIHPFDINICTKVVLNENCVGSGYDIIRYEFKIPLYESEMVEAMRENISPSGATYSDACKQYSKLVVGPRPNRSYGEIRIFYWIEKEDLTRNKMRGQSNLSPGDVNDVSMFDFPTDEGNRNDSNNLHKVFSFYVAAIDKPWHWSFYSCNGFSTSEKNPERDYDGIRPLWRDVLKTHERRPLHMIFGCGDQLYQDDVFDHCKTLKEWLSNPSSIEREKANFTVEMKKEVERYYFFHYLSHFTQPVLADAFTSVPHMMLIDDHDIFDGYGSYPEELQNCPVFASMGNIAKMFYLIFQQHTNIDRAYTEDGFFGAEGGFNFVRNLGPYTAICGSDGRWERTIKQVAAEGSWKMMAEHLDKLPKTCQHVILATGVPMTFPVLLLAEKVMQIVADIKRSKFFRRIFKNSKTYQLLGYNYGLPSNLDDLIDHLNSPSHIKERNMVLQLFTKFASKRHCRISCISGDVHCTGVGKFKMKEKTRSKLFSRKKVSKARRIPDARDPNAIFSITSSAIANQPPPASVMKVFQWESRSRKIKTNRYPGYHLRETMLDIFPNDPEGTALAGKQRRLIGRRNWCEVDEIIEKDLYHVEPQEELVGKNMIKKKNKHEFIKIKGGELKELPESFRKKNISIMGSPKEEYFDTFDASTNIDKDEVKSIKDLPSNRILVKPLIRHTHRSATSSETRNSIVNGSANINATNSKSNNAIGYSRRSSTPSSSPSSISQSTASPGPASVPQSPIRTFHDNNDGGNTNDINNAHTSWIKHAKDSGYLTNTDFNLSNNSINPDGKIINNFNITMPTNVDDTIEIEEQFTQMTINGPKNINKNEVTPENQTKSKFLLSLPWIRKCGEIQDPIPLSEIVDLYHNENIKMQNVNNERRNSSIIRFMKKQSKNKKNLNQENNDDYYVYKQFLSEAEKELEEMPLLVSIFRLHIELPRMEESKLPVNENFNLDPIFNDIDLNGNKDGGVAIYSLPIPRLY